jgi:hypothetical protein
MALLLLHDFQTFDFQTFDAAGSSSSFARGDR